MLDFVSPDPVALNARLRPDARAAIDLAGDRHWTYRTLDADIQRAVTVLTDRGVARGDRVAVLARNCVHQIILQQALMRMGAIFVPLNWRLSEKELAQLLADCTPRLLFTDRDAFDGGGIIVETMAMLVAAIDAAEPAPVGPAHGAQDTCIILYTSGTSGTPKGALLTPMFLLTTGFNFGTLGDVDTGDTFLCDSPMFHVMGIATQIWPALIRGGCCIVSSGFDAERTNDRLGDATLGITHYFCVPQMAESLRHAPNFRPDTWRLRALFTGGAPNPPAHIRWWADQGIPMVDGYGMTECGTILGMPRSLDIVRAKAGSVGLAGPLTTIRLVDADNRDVPVGTEGEILVSGPNVIAGYWNRPSEREPAFATPGWFRTGDIGLRDADGYVRIVDRLKDMFISGGENVYPVEVEAALCEDDTVREVAVIGVPCDTWGEVGCAYVVLAPGEVPDTDRLTRHCAGLIAKYKLPKKFRFVAALPRTGSGKVMKHVLRQQYLAEPKADA